MNRKNTDTRMNAAFSLVAISWISELLLLFYTAAIKHGGSVFELSEAGDLHRPTEVTCFFFVLYAFHERTRHAGARSYNSSEIYLTMFAGTWHHTTVEL